MEQFYEEERIHVSVLTNFFLSENIKTEVLPAEDYLSYKNIEDFLFLFFQDIDRKLFNKFVDFHIGKEIEDSSNKILLKNKAENNINFYLEKGDIKKAQSWEYLKKTIKEK